MAKWVECRYINEVGIEVGLTFSYGTQKQLNEIKLRFRLSKDNITRYNVYENGKILYSHD